MEVPKALTGVRLIFVLDEDGFYGGAEETGDAHGERQRRVVLARLDRVDGLAGDFEALCEVGLAPVALSAEDAETVLHRYLRRMTAWEIAMKTQQKA